MNLGAATAKTAEAKPKTGKRPSVFTLALISALLGVHSRSLRRSLTGWPALTTAFINGKYIPAWTLAGLPSGIAAGVAATVQELADGMGAAVNPLLRKEGRSPRKSYKLRSDAILMNLSVDKKNQIYTWIGVENCSYTEAVRRIESSFGIKVATSTVGNFYQAFCFPKIRGESGE